MNAESAQDFAAMERAGGNAEPEAGNHLLVTLAAMAGVLLLQLTLVPSRTINWDEFHFLNYVHQFTRGELTTPLQTLHVRFFAWLPGLDMSGVDQIVRARFAMFACELVTCGAIIAVARRFASLPAAVLCALAYLSVGYVFQHGFSFRTDPLVTMLAMSALALLARVRLGPFAIAGFSLLVGIAVMVSIKVVLLAPAFAGIAWLRWSEGGFSARSALQIAAAPLGAILVAGMIYYLHGLGLAPASEASDLVARSGTAMFFLGIPLNWKFAVGAVLFGLVFYALLVFALATLAGSGRFNRNEKLALLGLMLPVLAPLFYHNAYPYFYAFLLAPVAVGLAGALEQLSQRYGAAFLALILAGSAVFTWQREEPSHLDAQRQIQLAVEGMFAQPVSYFDFPGFFPQHRKANNFLSAWGFARYTNGDVPGFAEIMERESVPLLAALEPEKNPSLLAALEGGERRDMFSEEDLEALNSTYRAFWGPLYLAGAELQPGELREWQVRVPGPYSVDGTLSVNGQRYVNGEVIMLDRGVVLLEAGGVARGGLTWGDNIARPGFAPPARPYWTGF